MIKLPAPELQIEFGLLMKQLRETYLQDALIDTIRRLNIPEVDRELAIYVLPKSMSILAGHGLRAEMLFPIPLLLKANPRLLGYYRLLYGYSQKEFYTATTGIGRFKSLEERGKLSEANELHLPDLCSALCSAAQSLLAGMSALKIDLRILDELTLLTLGPQLRGGANVKRGATGIRIVFNIIQEIVAPSILTATDSCIEVINAADRKVLIEFAADPDIIIQVQMTSEFRKVIAIEVKAGADFSNIHNRLGEAEKSHRKARHAGFVECWTVVNVEPFNLDMAHRESPTTDRFYRISDLLNQDTSGYKDFRDRVISATAI